ncbi:MAG: glycoside hydrolase family protein [Faecalibacterium sp.]
MVKNPFEGKWAPVPKKGGFHMPGYHIWCGSPIADEDGTYHLFAAGWDARYGFDFNWLLRGKLIHAISNTPEGPYEFHSFVLGERDHKYFDARNQLCPYIMKYKDTYYLYYYGTTYGGDAPVSDGKLSRGRFVEIWNKKRIGLATSKSLYGPWERRDTPLLEPRDERYWDCTITTNPSVALLPDGKCYMIYKSRRNSDSPLQLGIAVADQPEGPFRRLTDDPIFQFENPKWWVEDPCLWYQDGKFHLLMKDDVRDDSGGITGEWGCGVYAQSDDCIHWEIAEHPKGYSRTLHWDDGSTTTQCHLERPCFLFQDGKPTHLFAATGTGSVPWEFEGETWNVCMPLIPESDS